MTSTGSYRRTVARCPQRCWRKKGLHPPAGQLSAERREFPGPRRQAYVFDGLDGKERCSSSLTAIAARVFISCSARSRQHALQSCSFWADSFDRNVAHLNARDVTVLPSRARLWRNSRPSRSAWADLQGSPPAAPIST